MDKIDSRLFCNGIHMNFSQIYKLPCKCYRCTKSVTSPVNFSNKQPENNSEQHSSNNTPNNNTN